MFKYGVELGELKLRSNVFIVWIRVQAKKNRFQNKRIIILEFFLK